MEAKNKVFIISGYYVASDAKGKFICDDCSFEKPWEGENFEIMRCLNKTGRCNGVMKLQLFQKERSGN